MFEPLFARVRWNPCIAAEAATYRHAGLRARVAPFRARQGVRMATADAASDCARAIDAREGG